MAAFPLWEHAMSFHAKPTTWTWTCSCPSGGEGAEGTESCHCDCDSDRRGAGKNGEGEGGNRPRNNGSRRRKRRRRSTRTEERTGPDPHVSALQQNVLIFDKLNMWSPDMPPFSWQRGGSGGGGLPGCRGSAALACRMHRRVHTAPGPAQYPFLALAAPSLRLAPLPLSLPLPCAAPVCRTPHSEMTPKTVGKLLRKCITACHFDTLWRFPHNAHLTLPFPLPFPLPATWQLRRASKSFSWPQPQRGLQKQFARPQRLMN